MDINQVDAIIGKIRGLKGKATPIAQHKLNYDAFAETLEPIYFWIIDMIKGKVEKLVDNFVASPGSGYFADMGSRATRMQEQGMKIIGTINTVMRSVLNLVYDLKEFDLRLEHYNKFKSKDPHSKEAGLLALKQIWLDRVDMKKGNGSINMLTAQLDFVTLRDAFMKIDDPKKVGKVDLNERVKRILKARLEELFEWIESSEKELRNRYNLQKHYLRSQVDSIKLYTRWAKPYLKAAEELTMKSRDNNDPNLVTAFNTISLELLIMSSKPVSLYKGFEAGLIPEKLKNVKLKRGYASYVFVSLKFRGLPQVAQRNEGTHYVHGGKTDIVFKGYAMNDDEIKAFRKEVEKQELYEGLKLVEGATTNSLDEIYKEVSKYLDPPKKEIEKKKQSLFDTFFKKPGKKEMKKSEEKKRKDIMKETFAERQAREVLAEADARSRTWKIYNLYKKGHGMATPLWEFDSFPNQ